MTPNEVLEVVTELNNDFDKVKGTHVSLTPFNMKIDSCIIYIMFLGETLLCVQHAKQSLKEAIKHAAEQMLEDLEYIKKI